MNSPKQERRLSDILVEIAELVEKVLAGEMDFPLLAGEPEGGKRDPADNPRGFG